MFKAVHYCRGAAILTALCLAVGLIGLTAAFVSAETNGVSLDLRLAAQTVPDTPQAHLQRGQALMENQEYNAALVEYRAATAMNPDLAAAHYGLAGALRAVGRTDDAITEYGRAIQIAPSMAMAYYDLGVTLTGAGQIQRAIGLLSAAVRLMPDNAPAHTALAQAYAIWGDFRHSAEQAQIATQLDPKLATGQVALGWALLKLGNTGGAVEAYKAAATVEPSDAQIKDGLGVAQSAAGDLDAAIASFRQAQRLAPNDARIANNLAAALRQSGQIDEAATDAAQSTALAPDTVQYFVNLAEIQRDSGNLDGAVLAYRNALRLDVSSAAVHKALGMTLYQRGKLISAIASYKDQAAGDVSDEAAMQAAADIAAYFAHGNRLTALAAMDPRAYQADFPMRLAPNPLPELRKDVQAITYALLRQPSFGGARTQLVSDMRNFETLQGELAAIASSPALVQATGNAYAITIPAPANMNAARNLNQGERRTLTALAVSLKSWQDLLDAACEFRWATKARPNDGEAFSELGLTFIELGDIPAAKLALQKAVKVQPDLASAHFNLGLALGYSRDMDGMLEQMSIAKSLGMNTPQVNTYMALAYMHFTEMPKAQSLLQEAVDMDPQYAPALYYLGLTQLAQLSASPLTASIGNEARAAAPYTSGAYGLKAEFVKTADAQEGLSRLTDAALADPDLEQFYVYPGIELVLQGSEAGADGLVVMHRVSSTNGLYPDWATVANNMAVAAQIAGQRDAAEVALKLATTEQSDYALAHWNQAQALGADGRTAEAQAESNRAAQLISAQQQPFALREPGVLAWQPDPPGPAPQSPIIPSLCESFHLAGHDC